MCFLTANIKDLTFELWARAGGRCEFEGCNKQLSREGLTWQRLNKSNIAHIIAKSPNGPRGDKILSKKLEKDISNLMLTCLEHHKLIDSKEHEKEYTVECLRTMKNKHERRIQKVTSIQPQCKSKIIIYGVKIGEKAIFVNEKDAEYALLPQYYPDGDKIELGLKNDSWYDGEPTYWLNQKENLYRQFSSLVTQELYNNKIKHLSVFAFAPQPLLIYLGTLISDKYPANIFQLNREFGNWKWEETGENTNYKINTPKNISFDGIPVLNISLSGIIDNRRIRTIIPNSDIWTLTINEPNTDFLRTKIQLYEFKKQARKILEEIKSKYKEGTILNIFPAMPISAAIEFGRLILPKTDMQMKIYDQVDNQTGFKYALTVNQTQERN